MPITEIVAAVSSLKTAINLVKDMKQTVDNVKLKETISPLFDTIIDLQSHILSINTEYQTILEDRNRIRQEIVDLKNWENEKEKYKLFEPGKGVFVYIPKDFQQSGEPEYYLCANCFQNKNIKSMLQKKGIAGFERFKHYCPSCQNEYQYNLDKSKQ